MIREFPDFSIQSCFTRFRRAPSQVQQLDILMNYPDFVFDWEAYDGTGRRGRIYESVDIQKVHVSFIKYTVIEAMSENETVVYVELGI